MGVVSYLAHVIVVSRDTASIAVGAAGGRDVAAAVGVVGYRAAVVESRDTARVAVGATGGRDAAAVGVVCYRTVVASRDTARVVEVAAAGGRDSAAAVGVVGYRAVVVSRDTARVVGVGATVGRDPALVGAVGYRAVVASCDTARVVFGAAGGRDSAAVGVVRYRAAVDSRDTARVVLCGAAGGRDSAVVGAVRYRAVAESRDTASEDKDCICVVADVNADDAADGEAADIGALAGEAEKARGEVAILVRAHHVGDDIAAHGEAAAVEAASVAVGGLGRVLTDGGPVRGAAALREVDVFCEFCVDLRAAAVDRITEPEEMARFRKQIDALIVRGRYHGVYRRPRGGGRGERREEEQE